MIYRITSFLWLLKASKILQFLVLLAYALSGNSYAESPAQCDIVYAVHDEGVQDSQIFTYNLANGNIKELGPLHLNLDLEGFDTHPKTHILYASSGQYNAKLYIVDAFSGALTLVDNIGFDNVKSLAFHPSGQLWAASDQGLLTINIDTGEGEIADKIIPNTINSLAWNSEGTQLFATVDDTENRSSTLWVYDESQQWQLACEGLPERVESLETLPDGTFIYGFHQDTELGIHQLNVNTCQTIDNAKIDTTFNDIEGIAWSTFSCNLSKIDALRTYFLNLDNVENVDINASGTIQVTIQGEIHHGQLDETITVGAPPASKQLTMTPTGDKNRDGIDDFLITYPSGEQQLLYYFGIKNINSKDCKVLTVPPIDSAFISIPSLVTKFLYTGDDPIQTGVTDGVINLEHAATLRGRVTNTEGEPLTNVTVTIKNYSEYGQTVTTCDGIFNMVVNGGNTITVNYNKAGYLPIQRNIKADWLEYAVLDDVVMTALDPTVTKIDLTSSTPIQVAKGSVITDSDGTRQAILLFPEGINATMVLPDGTNQALAELDIRATEYTVGEKGQQAMPGPLPSTSAYTYAVELSVDQAIAAGATHVNFSKPIPLYVDNFIGFPVGEIVPVGWYDYDKSAWIPSNNGRVIEIVSIVDGLAELDIDGSGHPASLSDLFELGITNEERQQLASLYLPGKTVWRSPIPHFSPWDCNWPIYALPSDAIPPGGMMPSDTTPGSTTPDKSSKVGPQLENDNNPEDPCKKSGCIIEVENQVLGETIPIIGTSFSLNYRSNRVPDYRVPYTLEINLREDVIPSILKEIILEISIAGQKIQKKFSPSVRKTTFIWDGLDAFGREVQGRQDAKVRIGYAYKLMYASSIDDGAKSFARVGDSDFSIDGRLGSSITLWKEYTKKLGILNSVKTGLGGSSLNIHHKYDALTQVLYKGNGKQYENRKLELDPLIKIIAGGGDILVKNDELQKHLAKSVKIFPNSLTIAPNGDIYFTSIKTHTPNHQVEVINDHRVYKIDINTGIISIAAGMDLNGMHGDGGLATQANLHSPRGISFDSSGNLYIADSGNHRIRKVDTNGIITTVAGNGSRNYSGIIEGNQLAIDVGLSYPSSVSVNNSGELYIVDNNRSYNRSYNRIQKVDTNGIITTVAGGGSYSSTYKNYSFIGDGKLATKLHLDSVKKVIFDSAGDLYLATGRIVGKIDSSGIFHVIAGNPNACNADMPINGVLATQACFKWIVDIAFTPYGELNILGKTHSDLYGIYHVSNSGFIKTIIERGQYSNSFSPSNIMFNSSGSMYISANKYIYQIDPLFPSFSMSNTLIASKSGSLLYEFSPSGQHLRTIDSTTLQSIYIFSYTKDGYLEKITDIDGDVTYIERNGATPVAIIAPYGQRTELLVNENNYITDVINPANEVSQLSYSENGLLTKFTTPRGHQSIYKYNDLGLLIEDSNPVGGGWVLDRVNHDKDNGYTTTITSKEGYATTYEVIPAGSGDITRTKTTPDGVKTQTVIKLFDNETTVTNADGTVIVSKQAPNPRFGMQAPFTQSINISTPNGLVNHTYIEKEVDLGDEGNILKPKSLLERVTINGRTSLGVYDAAENKVTGTSAEGRVVVSYFDKKGRIIKEETTGLAAIHYQYDERGRLVKTIKGEGIDARITTINYDPAGYIANIIDPLGHTGSFVRDNIGRVLTQTLPNTQQIHYSYDENGNLITITPPNRPAHSYTYNAVDEQIEYEAPDINLPFHETLSSFNLDQQVTRITRPDNKVIDFDYDEGGKLTKLALPKGSQTYQYSATTGKINHISDTASDTTLTYEYDGSLLLSEKWTTPNIEASVNYTYDTDFRINTLKVFDQEKITYKYDRDSLLIQAGDMVLSRKVENGLLKGTILGQITTKLEYDKFGNLEFEKANYQNKELYSAQYKYDKLERIIQKTETINGQIKQLFYQYDAVGRLIEVNNNGVITSFGYDENGNRTHINGLVVATYDNQDRLLQYRGQSYTYTDNGELLTKTKNEEITHYTYDVLTNLTSVKLPNEEIISYIIDGKERRIAKLVNGKLIEAYLYQGSIAPVALLDKNNKITAQFIYGSQDHVPDYMIKNGKVYRFITDNLGSVRLVVETISGEIVQQLEYDTWGNVLSDTNVGFQPFGYAGGMYESSTGLVRFGARDYDAETGRWTAQDPIGHASEETNLYSYVYNNPVDSIDPSGLFWAAAASACASGGASGAAQEALGQILDNGVGCLDWGEIGKAGVSGCLSGGLNKYAKLLKRNDPCNSFTSETLVHTESGLKLISDIEIGEKVLSYDERTEKNSYQPVTDIIQGNKSYQFVKLILESGESIEATAEHPFYIKGKGWNPASSLKAGTTLQLYNGIVVVVKQVDTSVRIDKVYNLTVANNHNYFVGNDGVLVHNANRGICKSSRKKAEENAYHPKGKFQGKPYPQPGKNASKAKKQRYEQQQKYRKPESHPNSKHPRPHYHAKNKKHESTLNNYHYYYPLK